MKICIVDMPLYLVRTGPFSPISVTADYQARALVELGHDVTVICASTSDIRIERFAQQSYGVEQVRIFPPVGTVSKVLMESVYALGATLIALRLKKAGTSMILYHHHPSALMVILLTPFFSTMKESIVVQHAGFNELYSRTIISISNAVKRLALPRVRLILAQSECVKAKIIRYFGVTKGRIEVLNISAGLDTDLFSPREPDRSILAERKQKDHDRIVLCIGSFCPRKNQMTLLKAFAKLLEDVPNARLLLDGNILEESYYERLLQFVDDKGLSDRVLFMRFLEHYSDLANLYNLADVCVLVSFEEGGLPRVIMEAMSCGRPCVVSDIPFITEYINDGDAFIVNPRSIEEITRAVKTALLDRGYAMSLAHSARQKMQQYKWRDLAEESIRLFNKQRGVREKVSTS